MPVLKMKREKYDGEFTLYNVVNYILGSACLYSGRALDPNNAVEQMQLVKEAYGKDRGRKVRHFVLSFASDEEIDYDDAMLLGFRICEYYSEYQTVYALHDNTKHLHLHFAVNTVAYTDGHMYSRGFDDWASLRAYIAALIPQWPVSLEY